MHLVGTVAVFDDFKEMPSSVKFITGMEKHEQLELSSVDIWLWYRKPWCYIYQFFQVRQSL